MAGLGEPRHAQVYPLIYQRYHSAAIEVFCNILDFIQNYTMQATLAFSARPLAVRRATAQTSRRNALVVRAEKKDVTRYVWMVAGICLKFHRRVLPCESMRCILHRQKYRWAFIAHRHM